MHACHNFTIPAAAGSELLQHSLAACLDDVHITQAYLHVQESNDEAIEFYIRHGFAVRETLKGYYKRLQPPEDALVLVKQLHDVGP